MAVQGSLSGRLKPEAVSTSVPNQSTVLFRADASLAIGSGHVMRCLTLADALAEVGVTCIFVCRSLPGNLVAAIQAKGYNVHVLAASLNVRDDVDVETRGDAEPDHAAWLEADWRDDASDTARLVETYDPDWLVVDHYALDARWEQAVAAPNRRCRILAIDDLADRSHVVDLLIDQNLGRKSQDYTDLVGKDCRLLIGPRYALLRPEFSRFREWSLERRQNTKLNRIFIAMGGVDKDNVTEDVLGSIQAARLPPAVSIDLVMGANAPWLDAIRAKAASMPMETRVFVNTTEIAHLMAMSDLAIGAAGSTSWERCCLGLPTLITVLADNQLPIARALDVSGAAHYVQDQKSLTSELSFLSGSSGSPMLAKMSAAASRVTQGDGADLVRDEMEKYDCS